MKDDDKRKYIPKNYYHIYDCLRNEEEPDEKKAEENHPILDLKFQPKIVLLLFIWFLIVAIGSIFINISDY